MNKYILSGFAIFALSANALANDTVAEISAGGLHYIHSQFISMAREDLYISKDQVRVDYVFHNGGEEDIRALVAFPMPDITPDPYSDIGVPYNDDNFLGFSVSVDGVAIQANLQQRASVVGVDITNQLVKRRIPLFPGADAAVDALAAQNGQAIVDLQALGAVFNDSYDVGQGMEDHLFPAWTLHSTYYWEMDFPAGQDVRVSHSYTPAVGATTGVTQTFYEGRAITKDYADRYCVDEGFVRAVHQRTGQGTQFFEKWISYILVTGRNWNGNIGVFHLTIDKGSTDNLVSFCGEGVIKTGPTTFELTIEDFYPEGNLEILLLEGMKF